MKIVEYRGVEGLVYAPVTVDDNETGTGHGFVTGEVKPLAGVAEISKASNASEETHFYDNGPAVVISSNGDDTITITASALDLEAYADITGETWDPTTGTLIEGERDPKYFAIGYKTKDTDGTEYYCWRMKGKFSVPESDHVTEDNGTTANGQTLTFTSIMSTHIFDNGKGAGKPGRAKAVTVNTALDLAANLSTFFDSVQTPDTITAKA